MCYINANAGTGSEDLSIGFDGLGVRNERGNPCTEEKELTIRNTWSSTEEEICKWEKSRSDQLENQIDYFCQTTDLRKELRNVHFLVEIASDYKLLFVNLL